MTIAPKLEIISKSDYPAAVCLINRAYRGDDASRSWTSEAHLLGGQRIDLERLEEMFSIPQRVFLGIREGEKLLACLLLEKLDSGPAYLGMLTVDVDLQAQGLGSKLVEAAEAWVKEHWQSKKMTMKVITKRAELLKWYEKRGYRRTGKLSPFPYGDVRSGIPKFQDLEFDELEKDLT